MSTDSAVPSEGPEQRVSGDQWKKLPVLVSYAYTRGEDPQQVSKILSEPRTELFLDSGAFSALNAGDKISLDKYLDFLHTHESNLWGYVQLDELGDPEQSQRNLEIMLNQDLSPIPVHVWGDQQQRMDELFAVSDVVALGGLRRPGRGHAPASYVKKKMQWARGRRVHWLGYCRKNMLATFRPFSCDASSWGAAHRYGTIKFYLGKGRWNQYRRQEKSEVMLSAKEQRILQQSGHDVDDFYNDDLWRNRAGEVELTDMVSANVTTYSFIRYAYDLKKTLGVRLFMATEPGRDYDLIEQQLTRYYQAQGWDA